MDDITLVDVIQTDLYYACKEMIETARENFRKGYVQVSWSGYDRIYNAIQQLDKMEE